MLFVNPGKFVPFCSDLPIYWFSYFGCLSLATWTIKKWINVIALRHTKQQIGTNTQQAKFPLFFSAIFARLEHESHMMKTKLYVLCEIPTCLNSLFCSQAAQAYSLCLRSHFAIYTHIKTLYGNSWIGWFIRLCMGIHSISQKYMILLWMMK